MLAGSEGGARGCSQNHAVHPCCTHREVGLKKGSFGVPAGGATALVASSAKQLAPGHGWMFLAAVAMGTVAMQLVALVMNNLSPFRAYPTYWY